MNFLKTKKGKLSFFCILSIALIIISIILIGPSVFWGKFRNKTNLGYYKQAYNTSENSSFDKKIHLNNGKKGISQKEINKNRTSCGKDLILKECTNDDIVNFWSTYNISGHFFWALERDIFPWLEHGWPILKTANDLVAEGKIDLFEALISEKLVAEEGHKEEVLKKVIKSIKEIGAKSDQTLLKIFSISFPAFIRLSRGKIDISQTMSLIRSFSDTLSRRGVNVINSPFGVIREKEKFNYYKAEISGSNISQNSNSENKSFEEENTNLSYDINKIPPTENRYELNEKGSGPLKKDIFSVDKNLTYKADRVLELSKNSLPNQIYANYSFNTNNNKSIILNGKLSGIFSLLKATQINTGKFLAPAITQKLISSYKRTLIYLPDLKKSIIYLLKLKKEFNELNQDEKRLVSNIAAIMNIILRQSDILSNVSLLPKDFVKYYKVLNIKIFSFNDGESVLDKLVEIVTGNGKINDALVATPYLYWRNDKSNKALNKSNTHYFNVVHYDVESNKFLIDDTNGKCFWMSRQKLKNLMKLNVKEPIRNYITNSEKRILENLFGKENKGSVSRALDIIEKTVKERVGGNYGFLVSDPNNVLGSKKSKLQGLG